MEYIVKNNKKINIKFLYNETQNYYTLLAVDDEKAVGKLTFKLDYRSFNRKLWLNKISVIDECSHLGVGTALLTMMEVFAYRNRISDVEGKYYPENEFAKPFYDKHGYDIWKDGYDWYVSKMLHEDKLKEISDNIPEFVIETEDETICSN